MKLAFFDRFTMRLPDESISDCSHTGDCDSDVSRWKPRIKELNKNIDLEDIQSELKQYGAWTCEELKDSEQNWNRIIWIAACNIKEEDRESN